MRPGEQFGDEHVYPEAGRIEPGTTRRVEVSFFFPEHMASTLSPGKRLRVQEGGTLIGTLTVRGTERRARCEDGHFGVGVRA